MTTRGMLEDDFVMVAQILHRIVKICLEVQDVTGKNLADFEKGIDDHKGVAQLREEVVSLAASLPYPYPLQNYLASAERVSMVDTTMDGKADTLAIDSTGDGVADTMIKLDKKHGR